MEDRRDVDHYGPFLFITVFLSLRVGLLLMHCFLCQ